MCFSSLLFKWGNNSLYTVLSGDQTLNVRKAQTQFPKKDGCILAFIIIPAFRHHGAGPETGSLRRRGPWDSRWNQVVGSPGESPWMEQASE